MIGTPARADSVKLFWPQCEINARRLGCPRIFKIELCLKVIVNLGVLYYSLLSTPPPHLFRNKFKNIYQSIAILHVQISNLEKLHFLNFLYHVFEK